MSQSLIHQDFQSQDWCTQLIHSPSIETIPWPSRPNPLPEDHPCSLFAQTLNTDTGIRAGHAMWKSDSRGEDVGQALLLVSLGTGMNYYPETLHGGMCAGLIDEGMGLLVFRKMGWATGVGSDTVTASIEIKLRGRIQTPGVCLIRAWADEEEAKKKGKKWTDMRKLWAKATIEDGAGHILMQARYLFIQTKKSEKL
ncbi:uncharacterized protein BDR25DRAFT_311740 [Lindgomyces ingoldianus]|uniref:Uncharacterized protein n=1 Tax=Lindgomyces ingoldianus TaxID=673940 RepID=A0ACB6R557_9PLEO|nr:uncharacterized protein BDR25DRAFT_311740 [Lindgomyces ingoldianus]KAF2474423.1 hypothetical protein BDR25DRAFT_311740 [Lindgomyces ingoldianus]